MQEAEPKQLLKLSHSVDLGRIAKLLTLSQALHQSCEAGRLHYHGNFKGKENQVWEDLTFRKQSIQNIYLMEQIK